MNPTEFTPYVSLIGGVLIGLSAVLFMLFNGRIEPMKTLTVLSVIQTIGILLLIIILLRDNEDQQSSYVGAESAQSLHTQNLKQKNTKNTSKQSISGELNEAQLREIIRSEFQANISAFVSTKNQTKTTRAETRSQAQLQEQRNKVAEEIEYYISTGTISEVNMSKLQSEIARLDERGRKQMMSKLVGAINNGQLAGRL